MNKKTTIDGPIYDARQLGTPKMLLLGLQHMFAMFGATVLVPALTGLDVATALLFAGIGTLLFRPSSAVPSLSSAATTPSAPSARQLTAARFMTTRSCPMHASAFLSQV